MILRLEKSCGERFEVKPLALWILFEQSIVKIEAVDIDVRSHQALIKQKPP